MMVISIITIINIIITTNLASICVLQTQAAALVPRECAGSQVAPDADPFVMGGGTFGGKPLLQHAWGGAAGKA